MSQNSNHSFYSRRRVCDYGDWLEVPTCRCGKDMKILTSWTDKNPGRRMWKCDENGGARKCGYWEWVDPPICDQAKRIILGLLKKSNAKDEEIKIMNMRTKEKQFRAFMVGFGVAFVINVAIYVLFM